MYFVRFPVGCVLIHTQTITIYVLATSVDLNEVVKAFVMLTGVLVSTMSVLHGESLFVSTHVADRS